MKEAKKTENFNFIYYFLGAGAVGFAAILQGLLPELKGKKVVIPICGGNIDTSILGRVLERALVADSRLIKLWVTISGKN